MLDEDTVESKLNAQTLPPAKKPTEETCQLPLEPSVLQLPDVSQPASQGVPAPVSTRSGKIVRRPAYLRDFNTWENSAKIFSNSSEQ